MKHTKEYAILAVAIVALGLYLFLRDTDRTTFILPDLQAFETQDITKIQIDQDDQALVLSRGDDQWQVSPGDHPAEEAKVKRMLDVLADLDITALVSETRNYARYELDDEHRIRVTAYRNGDIVRNLDIGKAADTMRHTHIALTDDPNVYHARGNFRSDFDQTVANLRDKTVLAFDKSAVEAFTIEAGNTKLNVTKTGAGPPEESEEAPATAEDEEAAPAQWQTEDGRVLDDESVDRLLVSLSGLRCRAYLSDRSRNDFDEPAYRIRIEADETARLDIFAPQETAATEVPAASSLRAEPFTLADFDVDPIEEFLSTAANDDPPADP